MTTNELTKRPPTEAQVFRKRAETIAGSLLTNWVGDKRAKEATGRLSAALAASAAAARNPQDFYDCEPASVATVVAVAALTGIMPATGATALAYAIPRRARKGEKPQLQYQLSHRGINALARRCGQTVIAVPISHRDDVDVDDAGEFVVLRRDFDNPPMTWEDLRGVQVLVKELGSGRVTFSGFMPRALIEPRRAMSDSWANERARPYSPWTKWPVEMAQKTAMHYAVGRGWCVIDDTAATRALAADQAADMIDTTASVADVRPSSIASITHVEPEPADVPDTEPEPASEAKTEPADSVADILLDRLDEVTDAAELKRIGKAIGEADVTAAELKTLSAKFDDVEATLSTQP
jgi:recombinational DNA repair protein RecT